MWKINYSEFYRIQLIINFKIVNFIIHILGKMYKHHSYGSVKKIKNFSYNPLDSIGKGFSSVVYRGQNDQNSNMETCFNLILSKIILEQNVAIKAIDMKGVRDSAAKEMLQYEIEALTVLNHQNIMKCYEVIRQTSYCYIVTELCNGGDLGQILKKRGKFDEQQTLKYLKGIVKGYIQIGTKGFLHRDLKLANVLVNNGQAKIADFGFSKKCKAQSIKQRYNVGSPLYMSPQALKHNIYSMKNDIWSIGIMAFEMLHGDTPWQCKTQKQLIDKMTKIPVKFRDSLKISSDTKDFIRKCLDINETKRMSLQGLKQWISQSQGNNDKQNSENIPNYQPKLLQKPTTFDKLDHKPETRPLSELTNRMHNNQASKSVNKIKVIQGGQASAKVQLSKSAVNFNNNVIIKQIILFRLFFKALQKLKNNSELVSPSQLRNILGNQTIRRVTLLKKLICSQEISTNHHFSLKNVQVYLNPIYNPDVKKYKTVVQEYFSKYTSEIKMQILQDKSSPASIISNFLKTLPQTFIQKQSLLIHWLLNLTHANTGLSKSQLQMILQPKQQLRSNQLRQKIQLICV